MLNRMIDDLINKGYYIAKIDGALCRNLDSAISNIAIAFRFPDYYGNNMNAFRECINDLDWIGEKNYAIVIDDSELFMIDDTEDNRLYLVDALRLISEEWANVPNYNGEDKFRQKSDFKVISI